MKRILILAVLVCAMALALVSCSNRPRRDVGYSEMTAGAYLTSCQVQHENLLVCQCVLHASEARYTESQFIDFSQQANAGTLNPNVLAKMIKTRDSCAIYWTQQ